MPEDDGTGAVRHSEWITLLAILAIIAGEIAYLLAGYVWPGWPPMSR